MTNKYDEVSREIKGLNKPLYPSDKPPFYTVEDLGQKLYMHEHIILQALTLASHIEEHKEELKALVDENTMPCHTCQASGCVNGMNCCGNVTNGGECRSHCVVQTQEQCPDCGGVGTFTRPILKTLLEGME